MTKKHSTKKALFSSILSFMLCISMFTGTTFAWFTDSVTSSNNIIQSGNLDVELYYQVEQQTDWTKVTESTNVFKTNTLWEPGHTEVVKLKVVNEGSLALKYRLGVNVASEVGSTNVYDKEFKLSEFIEYGIVEGAQTYASSAEAVKAVEATATKLSTAYNSADTNLDAKNDADTDEKIVTMVVYMPEKVGNDANAKKGAAVPTINLGINLLASQRAYESDSFGPEYDKDSTYPVNVTVAESVTPDANDKTTEEVTLTYATDTSAITNVEVVVPQGAQLEADTTELVLKIEEAESVNADVATQITSKQTATTYEISLEGLAATNDKDVEVTLTIEKGLIDVVLYHKGTMIPCDYDPSTGVLSFTTKGFSPFTVVSTAQTFDEGDGSKANPFVINKPEDLLNISKYYHEYKYYEVAEDVKTLDLNGIGNLSLYGSFDGNGVKIVNLTTSLFVNVGHPKDEAEIKISDMDVTVYTTNGRALVRNIYNAGETIFENVAMHGYIEGQYNMGSFYNYGTANHGSSDGSDYTVSFINATSDATLVCTTGNVIGGMLGHGYQGADYVLSVNMDEKSGYTGKMYTTNGATCYQVMAMCSTGTYVLNGEEISRYTNTYASTKLAISAPTANNDGYYVTPAEGVDHYVVYVNAQITAYDENGNKIANLAGMTGNLGNVTITEGFDGKIFDLISSAKIVNGLDHDYSYEMKDGELTVYTGRAENYASGWITLQVNQYDKDGNLIATGITTVHTFADPVLASSSAELEEAIAAAGNNTVILLKDIDMGSATLKITKDTTIDLNGHTLKGTCNAGQAHLIMINNGVTLNVCDNSKAQTGKITYAQGTSNVGWTIDVEGVLNLYSGTLELTGSWSIGYAVDVRPNAWGTAYTEGTAFNMYGGKVISSDGAVRVASSSSETYTGVSASFVMYDGEIKAAWDGVFVQQSNAAYDILNVQLLGGSITSSDLAAVRFYGPNATSVVGGVEKPMTLVLGGTELVSAELTDKTWFVEGKILVGGGMSLDNLNQYLTVTNK